MNWKYFEVLLQVAVALSFTAWNNGNDSEHNLIGSYINSDISNGWTSFQGPVLGPQSQTVKEEDIINTIINWEENQRATRLAYNADFVAYPLVNQDNGFNVPLPETDAPSSPVLCSPATELSPSSSNGLETSSTTCLSSPSIEWLQSPGSSEEGGELFGAVGYTPENTRQYFDIESFLNADESLEDISNDSYLDMVVGPHWVDQPLLPESGDTETIEELAQFLKDSLYEKESNIYGDKESSCHSAPPNQKMAMSDDFEKSDDETFDYYYKKHDATMVQPIPIDELGLLKSLSTDEEDREYKGDYIADLRSYKDAVQEPYAQVKQKLKTEKASPCKRSFSNSRTKAEYFSSSEPLGENLNYFPEKCQTNNSGAWIKKDDVFSSFPYPKEHIIQMEIEEFNQLISKLDPLQQHLAKDIRRKGKNKLAARNCRKRKVDAIDGLDVNLQQLEKQKQLLLDEKLMLQEEKNEIHRKTQFLQEHIFKNLRDNNGLPYSESEFALTYSTDGTVYLVPKNVQRKEIHSR